MKIETSKVKFKCDHCAEQTQDTNHGEDCFPYKNNWIYLHNLNFKLVKNHYINLNDKHFCSSFCFVLWLSNLIKKEKKEWA